MAQPTGLEPLPLPSDVTEDYVDCTASCGLNFHVLKAGKPGQPLVLFCHGYPELAYSWRKVLPAVAAAGYYCVAMDQRGYGRTTGWDTRGYHDVDLASFTMTNVVRDLVCLAYRLGYARTAAIVGHDFGAVASAMAALMRPDVFRASVQMSHPHHKPPAPPLGEHTTPPPPLDIQAELAKLSPPRKHYKWYNSSPPAAHDWDHPPQGMEAFLRGYFHLKSADWAGNAPHPLTEWSAAALAEMPEYYVMGAGDSMPATVAKGMAGESEAAARESEAWLGADELRIYAGEWARTGFGGALNWYRAQTASTEASRKDMLLFAGRRIEVPCAFISGKQDWGNYQQPGALEGYDDPESVVPGCFKGMTLIDHAGHWVQQEQPEVVIEAVLKFLKGL